MILNKETKPSEHWYDKDGNPMHDADLRAARKKGLFPSVTSILKIQSNPGLENWKLREAVLSSLTLPRLAGESDQDFARRILEDSGSHARQSADIGNLHHDFAETYYKERKAGLIPGYSKNSLCLVDWIEENLGEGFAEQSFCNNEYGYAGKIDWTGWLRQWPDQMGYVDYKTQGIKPGDSPVFYPSWCQQLAAYSGGNPNVLHISVVLGSLPENQGLWVRVWKESEVEKGWRIFKHLLAIWMLDRGYDPREARE
jgi:hypothetical protein